ncbi:MAG TPA: FkbM family methyltransferase, partial [Vicinamibacterales bacterium]|nr:FkbM family methyltransferase [Vicinamibacterales bacterium]
MAWRAALTGIRGTLARVIARAVDRFPAIEPAFVRAGRAVQRNYPLASLYYQAHTALSARLRASGRRFRPLTIDGVAVEVDVTDHSARLLFFQDVAYEPEVTRHLIAGLAPGDVFVDIGANAGFFAAIGALRVGPTGRVVAFEPHPDARRAMEELLARNRVADRVDVIAAAIGNCVADTVPLHMAADCVLSTLVPDRSPLRADFAFDTSIDVPMTTLDAWMHRHPDLEPRIAAIKIDVEGFEDEAVAGMAATLERATRTIVICETNPTSRADARLRGAGFVRQPLEVDGNG